MASGHFFPSNLKITKENEDEFVKNMMNPPKGGFDPKYKSSAVEMDKKDREAFMNRIIKKNKND